MTASERAALEDANNVLTALLAVVEAQDSATIFKDTVFYDKLFKPARAAVKAAVSEAYINDRVREAAKT